MRLIIFDTETSGLPRPSVAALAKQPRIIEFGAMLITERGTLIKELSMLINPGFAVSEEITKITGIKPEDLQDKPGFQTHLPAIEGLFRCADILISHNLPFDHSLLRYELMLAGCEDFPWPDQLICTAQEYTSRMGFRPHLKDLYETIMGRPLAQTHRALDDAHAVYDIIMKDGFLERIGVS